MTPRRYDGTLCTAGRRFQLFARFSNGSFLKDFIVENTQNRNAAAMSLELDATIRAIAQPRDDIIDTENAPEVERIRLKERYKLPSEQQDALES